MCALSGHRDPLNYMTLRPHCAAPHPQSLEMSGVTAQHDPPDLVLPVGVMHPSLAALMPTMGGDKPADLTREHITAVAGQLHQAWLLAGTALPSSQIPAQSRGVFPLDPSIRRGRLEITNACCLCEPGCLPTLVFSHQQCCFVCDCRCLMHTADVAQDPTVHKVMSCSPA